jgi:hypothetical protein
MSRLVLSPLNEYSTTPEPTRLTFSTAANESARDGFHSEANRGTSMMLAKQEMAYRNAVVERAVVGDTTCAINTGRKKLHARSFAQRIVWSTTKSFHDDIFALLQCCIVISRNNVHAKCVVLCYWTTRARG